MNDIGRNDPCHCGSKKKYKKCCLEKDENKYRKEREKAALNAAKVMAEKAEAEAKNDKKTPGSSPSASAPVQKPHESHQQGWMGKVASKVGFFQKFTQRKTGGGNKGG